MHTEKSTPGRRIVVSAIGVALLLGLCYVLLSRHSGRKPFTVHDLYQLEASAWRKRDDVDLTLRTAIAYASFVHHAGSLRRAMESTREFVQMTAPFLSEQGKASVQRQLEEVEAKYAALRREYGIHSEAEWQHVLTRGIEFTHRALQRGDLDASRRATLHLALGQLLCHADRLSEAMQQAQLAERYGGRSIPLCLLRADIMERQERYGEALQELRAASIQLTAWAAQAPPWELRFVWALTSPNRVNTRERRWRERREKVASELRYVIASEISLLQALQRIQERRTPSYAP